MTRCAEFAEDLGLLLAGELEAGRRAALLAHLEGCPGCARERAVFEQAFDDLRAAEVPDPGPVYWAGFESRLRSRLEARRAAGRRRTLLLAAAAALVMAAGLGLLLGRRPGDAGADGGNVAAIAPGGDAAPADIAGRAPGDRGGPGSSSAESPIDVAAATEAERAEDRLEAALHAARSRPSGDEEFESILDEIAPGDPYAFMGFDDAETEHGSGV